MRRGLGVMRAVIAVMTAAICLLFIWQAADILRTGAERTAAGQTVYSRQIVAERFGRIAPAVYAYLAAVAVGLVWQAAAKEKKPRPAAISPAEKKPSKYLAAARLVLLGAAVALVVLGVINGGAHDVLVKAVNICTECIGLG